MFTCQRQSNQELARDAMQDLDTKLKMLHNPDDVRTSLILGLTLFLKGENSVGCIGMVPAAVTQESQGWMHVLQGRLITEWLSFLPDTTAQMTWHTKVLRNLLEIGRAFWVLRCAEVNKSETSKTSTIYAQMEELYHLQNTYNLIDPIYFKKTLLQRSVFPLGTNKTWVSLAYKSYQARRTNLKRSKSNLHHYFSIRYPSANTVLFNATLKHWTKAKVHYEGNHPESTLEERYQTTLYSYFLDEGLEESSIT